MIYYTQIITEISQVTYVSQDKLALSSLIQVDASVYRFAHLFIRDNGILVDER